MNFKEWLLSEELKSANALKPKLTTTIPQLNKGQEKYRKPSSENFKELAIYYGRNGSAPSITESNPENKSLGVWHSSKKIRTSNPHEESDKTWAEIVSKFPNWIDPVTKKPFIYKDLPKDWRDIRPKVRQEKGRENSNKRLEELAIFYGRNGFRPSTTESNPEDKSLGVWHNKKKITNTNPHEESDKTWAEIVSKFPNWIDPVTKKPFIYKDLPKDWRKVKSKATQEKGRKNRSNKRLEELAIFYGRNGSAPSITESNPENKSLGVWLNGKKITNPNPHEKSDKAWAEIVSKFPNWIDPVTKEPFIYKDLPKDWRKVKPNGWQKHLQKNQNSSSKRLEELAIYYGRNGSAPSKTEPNPEDKILGIWHSNKKYNPNPYKESDDKAWADIVSKFPNWIDPVTKEPFIYKDLPKDWRKVKPKSSGEKSLGEKYVLNILTELGIENEPQYRDKACNNKRCLPFDFSITHNGKKYLEFHGGQHYVPTYFGSREEKTDQLKASHALENFKYTRKNDKIKYNHCAKGNFPFLVIPYWLDKNSDIVKNIIIEFLNTNEFDKNFANPDVPQKNKEYHDRIFKMTKCFAKGKVNCKKLF